LHFLINICFSGSLHCLHLKSNISERIAFIAAGRLNHQNMANSEIEKVARD
jgi:hypothetical protein